ncbi:gliding motility-associated ABC transporter substrate-binding protein GldG [Flavihumibacter stibioxidans]|uniref:Gliding motility-associated ABC transporter substrate-binding protein GldG n=1 Tax=Flavihumibacter stibioxidans TaxID=1834163 RepID=A0ABR7M6Z7_9BACT|nr:gliding motility-associated ABC transporter substrate-binding protein GldG [Flavihumibacter stibioxidans]MBC6490604.1 gliding motility-associated ABC transporter substrate-binding protein GldG [Flavihumibacter stibioxidans]
MKKLPHSKYYWIVLLVLVLLINWIAGLVPFRADLTAEGRYTLSKPARQLLTGLNEPVSVDVLLSGEMPAGFRKLANSTNDLLQEFKSAGKTNFRFRFIKPGEGLNDSSKAILYDSLANLGLNPTNIKAQTKEGEGQEERLVFPGAVITHKGRTTAIDLLQGVSSEGGLESLNKAEALLEYKFANAIRQLNQDTVPLIGYLVGNGEPESYQVYDLIENVLKKNYAFRILPIDSVPIIPPVFDALIVAKPSIAFGDDQKLKIDQYVMQGGKMLWMIDNLYAEMDSLQRSQADFIAFDRGLQLEDLLFKYGVRINQDLLQDLNADKIPSVIGSVGGKPQIQLLPWPYFPLLSNYSGHPVAKNMDYVLSQFPNSIDTVEAKGIRKNILLSSSIDTRLLATPARVSWQSIETEDDLKTFNQGNKPVAVLLEGSFSSLYANRATAEERAALQAAGQPFNTSSPENKMIVIADGDIALNAVTQNEGPLPMGMNSYTKYQYANRDFIQNCIEYLVDESGILETRGKDFTLRLLDKKKMEAAKTKWQLINILVPVLLIILFGLVYQWWRKHRYQGKTEK